MLIRAVILLALVVRLLPAQPVMTGGSAASLAALVEAGLICHADEPADADTDPAGGSGGQHDHDCALCPVCLTHAPILALLPDGPAIRPASRPESVRHATPPATGPPLLRFALHHPRGPPV
jgi:hypothetical protein